jgi:hypothetical protein
MREVLEAGKDPVTAEPLYVLLSLAGHPDAHEQARVLARQAKAASVSLAQVIRADQSVQPYFQRLSAEQRAVLDDPARYLGAAEQTARAVCDDWEKRLAQES